MREKKVDVIALQETHTIDNADLHKWGKIAGYNLIGAIHYKQYGVATYFNSRVSHARTRDSGRGIYSDSECEWSKYSKCVQTTQYIIE